MGVQRGGFYDRNILTLNIWSQCSIGNFVTIYIYLYICKNHSRMVNRKKPTSITTTVFLVSQGGGEQTSSVDRLRSEKNRLVTFTLWENRGWPENDFRYTRTCWAFLEKVVRYTKCLELQMFKLRFLTLCHFTLQILLHDVLRYSFLHY